MKNIKVVHNAFGTSMVKVAMVLSDSENVMEALEEAYTKTNNIFQSWALNKGVSTSYPGGRRSTSVGDFMEVDGDWYEVADFGFEKRNEEDSIRDLYLDENEEWASRFISFGDLVGEIS